MLLVALEQWWVGGACWALCGVAAWYTGDPEFRRRMGVLALCTAALALAPIDTNLSNEHFLSLGAVLALLAIGVPLLLHRTDPAVVRYRWWPAPPRIPQLAYIALAIPVSWAGLKLYFHLSPEIATNWPLEATPNQETLWRLFIAINGVGLWEELFFVNVAFALLRMMFSFPLANLAQASLYTAVLGDMAFTEWGPVFVYTFALTQGLLFERSHSLFNVIVVHLIVDWFLFEEIVAAHYPGTSALSLLLG